MSDRCLYRIEVKVVGYAYTESEEAARRFARDLVADWDADDVRVRPVREKGESPPGTWDADCLVWTDGQEEVTLGDVWPGDPLHGGDR